MAGPEECKGERTVDKTEMTFHVPNRYRIRHGDLASGDLAGNNGAFEIRCAGKKLFVLASDGGGWEHVSVSTKHKIPTWKQMCHIRNIFWDKEATVFQFHPPQSQYVNCCKTCLHLWRQVGVKVELPPRWMLAP